MANELLATPLNGKLFVVPLLRRVLRAATALATVLLLIVVGSGSVTAQEDDEVRLEELQAERDELQGELAEAASQVNASEASFEEVLTALDDINALVDIQEARLEDAEQAVGSAERLVEQAEARREQILAEQAELRVAVADLAVASFTGESGENGEDLTALLLNENPTEAARRRSLVQLQTGNLGDTLDRVRQLDSEAEQVEADRERAVQAALTNRADVEQRRVELSDAVDLQVQLVLDVEARLESRLAEAQALESLDTELAAEIRQQEEEIARRIRAEAAARAAAAAAAQAARQPPLPSDGEIVNAEGFAVHVSVADAVGRMIRDARDDGVSLTGSGWRSPQRTEELRVINGCPDIHTSPPSSCRIPTARPGQSMHERGLAIDFASCWRGSACFIWLSNNAANYGFFNLPSESWHWSTNGR